MKARTYIRVERLGANEEDERTLGGTARRRTRKPDAHDRKWLADFAKKTRAMSRQMMSTRVPFRLVVKRYRDGEALMRRLVREVLQQGKAIP